MEHVRSADGTRIAYDRSGEGPPLLLVHAITGDHRRWAPLLPQLTPHFTVCAMDRRGRGASGDGPDYSLEAEGEDIAAVVEAIGDHVSLLGYSSGAVCCLEAVLRTAAVDRLILFEPPIPIPPGQPMTPPDVLERMERQIAEGDLEEATLTFLRGAVRMSKSDIEAGRALPSWPLRVAGAPLLLRETQAVERYAFAPARFSGLTASTLLLYGSETSPQLRAAIEALAAAIPQCETRSLAGQGHAALDTAPELLGSEVLRFLLPTT